MTLPVVAFALCACGSDGGGNPDGSNNDLAGAADLTPDDPNRVPTLMPASASVRRNGTVGFTADAPVTFSVREARGGTIAADGTYTAPSVVGTFTVVAARTDNPSVTATATVRVEFGELVVVAGALGGAGSADGAGSDARFGEFGDQLAADSAGSLYIVDRGNATVRRIAAGTDEVSTVAGQAGTTRAVTNAVGAAARFADPSGIAVDPAGTTLFVSECSAHVVRRIDLATRTVTTLAGSPGMNGSTVGTNGGEARFDCPTGLAWDDVAGWLYVADRNNATIRRVKTAAGADQGKAELFAGEVGVTGTSDTPPHFNNPTSLHLDRAGGQLYVVDQTNRYVRRISTSASPATTVTTLPTAAFQWNAPRAVALFQSRVHVGQLSELTRIEDNNATTTVAGHVSQLGYADGTAGAARFMGIAGLATVSSDAFVADRAPTTPLLSINNGVVANGGAIRKVTLPAGVTTTRAGLPRQIGYTDGTGSSARFEMPVAVLADSDGSIYVGDEQNWRLRKIALGAAGAPATVSSVAGDGTCCGTTPTATAGASAKLAQLRCMTVTGRTMIACDAGATALAKIDLSTADYQTQTIVVSGASPRGVAVKGGNTVYFSTGSEKWNGMPRTGDHGILSINLSSPGTPTRAFGSATGQADPASGSIDGTGTSAYFSSPSGLALDETEGVMFVADSGHHAIRRIDLGTGAVTTIGGAANQAGYADGATGTSRFNDPAQLVYKDGALFIADRGNHVIRRLDVATGVTTTVLGTPGVAGVRTAGALALNTPHSISFLSTGEMLVVFGRSESAVVLAR